jgi:iron(III) transport system permease protein
MAGVIAGTAIIGAGTAWLVTTYDVPGRRVLQWALMLPLAAPTYVVAYVYTDILEYAGPVQMALRELGGWQSRQDYWFPEIRSLGGAIAVMSLTLYPYVYLLARAAFIEQSVCLTETARSLGCTAWQSFWRVSLPMARPSIAVGLALAMMECLNDFGTVDYFAVHTLTAGLFNVWLLMQNPGGGAQIALVMLGFVIALLLLERLARRQRRFHNTSGRYRNVAPQRLSRSGRAAALAACTLPVILGFVIPAGLLANYAIAFFGEAWSNRFPEAAANTLLLAAIAALVTVVIGVFLAAALRSRGGWLITYLARFASLGYAVPGAVLAIGILIPFGAFDNWLDSAADSIFGIRTGLLLSGTLAALVFAYVVRFMALSFGTIDAAMTRVTPAMEMAARTLGHNALQTLYRVNLPIIRGSLLTAGLLVFVDVAKELPATLLLRPFNFDTLATYVYQFASDELLEQSALGALTIVAIGLVPVIALTRTISASRPGQGML